MRRYNANLSSESALTIDSSANVNGQPSAHVPFIIGLDLVTSLLNNLPSQHQYNYFRRRDKCRNRDENTTQEFSCLVNH